MTTNQKGGRMSCDCDSCFCTNQKGDAVVENDLMALGKEELVETILTQAREIEDLTLRLDAIVALEDS